MWKWLHVPRFQHQPHDSPDAGGKGQDRAGDAHIPAQDRRHAQGGGRGQRGAGQRPRGRAHRVLEQDAHERGDRRDPRRAGAASCRGGTQPPPSRSERESPSPVPVKARSPQGQTRLPNRLHGAKVADRKTLKKTVWLAIRPENRGFYVLEERPDPTNPVVPRILLAHRF